MVFWTSSLFFRMGGWKKYVYVWSETVWVFFGHKANWVLMKFGGKKFKVCEKYQGFFGQRFTRFFLLLEFYVSSLAIFFMDVFFHLPHVMDNGVLFIGKAF